MKGLKPLQFGLHGCLTVPGDKSIFHRAVMLGALSHGVTVIHHFLPGEDCLSTIQAFRDLGVEIEVAGDMVTVRGMGLTPFLHLSTRLTWAILALPPA